MACSKWWLAGAVGLALLVAGAPAVRAQGYERARTLFEAARKEQDPQKRVALLRESVAVSEQFENAMTLGDTLLVGLHEPVEARHWFVRALGRAVSPKAMAQAAAQVAGTYEGSPACLSDRIAWLKRSLGYQRLPEVEDLLKQALQTSRSAPVLDAAAIRAQLRSCEAGAEIRTAARGVGIAPSVELRIEFDYDRDTLSSIGRSQAQQLGEALSAPDYRDRTIRLIGHTDARGTDAYNDDLSRRRARTVGDFLVRQFGFSSAKVVPEGRGKRDLLFSGDTEAIHAMNRRVEVRVQNASPEVERLRTATDLNLWNELERLVVRASMGLDVQTKTTLLDGDKLVVAVTVPFDGYVNVLNLSEDDPQITVLFPNAYRQDNFVRAGTVLAIPGPTDRFSLPVSLPEGRSEQRTLIAAMVSREKLSAYESGTGTATFRSLKGTASGTRSFFVEAAVAAEPPPPQDPPPARLPSPPNVADRTYAAGKVVAVIRPRSR